MLSLDEPAAPLILLIDSDAGCRRHLAGALSVARFRVAEIETFAGAVDAVSTVRPDLVLIDPGLPHLEGLQLCDALRGLPEGRQIPVLLLLEAQRAELLPQVFAAGVTDVMTKPVSPDLLVHRVRFMLRADAGRKALHRRETAMERIQRLAGIGIWEWETTGNQVRVSESLRQLARLPASGFGGTLEAFLDLFHPGTRHEVTTVLQACHAEGRAFSCVQRLVAGSDEIGVLLRGEPSCSADGTPIGVFGLVQDISAYSQAEDRLLLFKEAMDALPIGITITDVHGCIVYSNPAEAGIHGYTPEELVRQRASIFAPEQLRKRVDPEELKNFTPWRRESSNCRKNGEVFPVQLTSIAVRNGRGDPLGLVTACEDITQRKEAEQRIEQLAFSDSLTGLPNRWMFQDRLRQALALAEREGRQLAVLFLDLDRFKFVNDTMGHDFGDLLLQAVAKRLGECMRKADTVARMGGDEFVVLLTLVEAQSGVTASARRILDAFERPFVLNERQVYSVPSIGIALYPADGTTVEDILKNADTAMYHAKALGGQTYQFFSAELNRQVTERMALEAQLRRALDFNEFVLYYQPQIDIVTGRLVGVEALVRWQHPEHGLILPAQFIAVLEATGLICRLGEWVLRTACAQAVQWRRTLAPELRVGVNVSAHQFRQPEFLTVLTTVLEETGLAPTALELELTESVLMEEPDIAGRVLRAIRELGVELSIDDFGTGYSSLSYLKNFPITSIKIDRSFVFDVVRNGEDAAIVEAILRMAECLNMTTIAEGVENQQQADFLLARGCRFSQGFLYSPPLSSEGCSRFLLERGRCAPDGA